MAKVLETLRQRSPRVPVPEPTLAVLATPVEEEAVDETMSFIEVGGCKAVLEASADVMPCMPVAVASPPVPEKLDPSALSVTFRPHRAEQAALRPPQARFARELVAFHRCDAAAGRQYQAVAAAVAEQVALARSSVLWFVAARPGAGATTVVLNLAITYARQGKLRVVAVDANFARPGIASRLGVSPAPGLRQILQGTATLAQSLQETGQSNLTALTAGDTGECKPVRCSADALRALLRQLSDRFEFVLIDAPCWDGYAETAALAGLSDAAFVVTPHDEDESARTTALIGSLTQQGCPLRGQLFTAK